MQPDQRQRGAEPAALRGRVDADDVHLAEIVAVHLRPVEAEQLAGAARRTAMNNPAGSNHGSPRRSAMSASVQPPCSGCHANAALLTRSSSASSAGPE